MLTVYLYGRKSCSLCQDAYTQLQAILPKSAVFVYIDMDTVDGSALADFLDIFDIPTVIASNGHGPDSPGSLRFDDRIPSLSDLTALL